MHEPTWRGEQTRDTLAELQKTLPPDRIVKETLDGRYIFGYKGTSIAPSSWDHPVQSFDYARYKLQEDDYLPGPCYEPEYEALSYTWSSDLPSTKAIVHSSTISGHDSIAEIELGGNLASALKHLRYGDKSRVLWIDAICINQGDNAERNFQVKRMGRIYSFAWRVIVWLGPEGGGSTHALSTLQRLASQVELTVDNSLCASPGASEPDWYYPFCPLPSEIFDDTTYSSIRSLFSRAWFSRVWVAQEVTLANRFSVVQCGSYCMPWLNLRKAIGILRAKRSTPDDVKAILDPQVPGVPPPVMRPLSRLLRLARHRSCKLPHDKVYGILSLASPELSSLIEPNYQKSASEVFQNVFLAQLKLTQRLDLLQYCSISSQYPETPSWVPNWETGPKTVLFGLRTGHFRQASGLSATPYDSLSDNALPVAGVKWAYVKSVGHTTAGNVNQILDIIRTWEPEGLHEDSYKPGGSMLDAFLEAVFQGCLRDRFPRAVSWPTLSELREHYLALLTGTGPRTNILKYLQNGVAEAAKFFVTNEGYLGVAEQDVKEGECFACLSNLSF